MANYVKILLILILSFGLLIQKAFALSNFKEVLTPVVGIVNLKYKVGHESKCTAKESAKDAGDFFKKTTESVYAISIIENPTRKLKLQTSILNIGIDFLETDVLLTEDGTIIPSQVLERRTSLNLKDDKGVFLSNAKMNASTMGHGLDLKQNFTFIADLCLLIPYGETIKTSGESIVIGMATISGRKNIISRSDQTSQCKWLGLDYTINNKSWMAVDVLSGLLSKSSAVSSVKFNDGDFVISENDVDCVFKTMPVSAQTVLKNSETASSIENRLVELKGLLEKGLISQEIFDQKRIEILRSL